MALTKVIGSGVEGISNASNATFLTATAAEGVTLAGTLAVTGVHTVGTNAVATSEGGAATTNILQGLAKAWAKYATNDGTSITDSFNVGSLTDNAVGRTYINFSNNMANTNATASGNVGDRKVNNSVYMDTTARAFNITFHTIDDGDVDKATVSVIIHGDLA